MAHTLKYRTAHVGREENCGLFSVVLFSGSLGLPAGSVLGAVLLLWVMQLTHIPKPLHRASTANVAQKSQATFVLPNREGLALDAVPLPVTVFN